MPDDGYDALLNDDDRFCHSALGNADGASLTALTSTLIPTHPHLGRAPRPRTYEQMETQCPRR